MTQMLAYFLSTPETITPLGKLARTERMHDCPLRKRVTDMRQKTANYATMGATMAPNLRSITLGARQTLRLTQKGLAKRLACSERTVQRWELGQSVPSSQQLRELARAVFPIDPKLAEACALASATTLEALGIAQRRP